MILGLDLGTKLGYYIEGDKKARSFSLGKSDDRFVEFMVFLEMQLQEGKIKHVAFEEPVIRGLSGKFFNCLIGILKASCLYYGVTYVGIPVKTMKKTFTGSGDADKKDIMKKCDKLKIKYDDDNAADAYGVYWSYKELNK